LTLLPIEVVLKVLWKVYGFVFSLTVKDNNISTQKTIKTRKPSKPQN